MSLRNAVTSHVTRFNSDKFWKMYMSCQSGDVSKIKKAWYIYRIKRITSLHCCDFMVASNRPNNFGAFFQTPPYLPHGLNGIVVSNKAKIGKNSTILQQVTIGIKKFPEGNAPIIGDNVFMGAGAKILGDITIGNNVTIGANSVAMCDVPDNCIAVGVPARIIEKKKD